MPGPLVIIDGHNLFIRNYCVQTMMTRDGERCGGTVGTLASVKKLLNDLTPSNVLVVWDGEGGSQRRKAIYGAYKEGRTIRLNKREDDMEESPERSLANMREQRQAAADFLSLLGIPQVRADGVEADDLMAYVAGKMDHEGGCVIVTTDQDLLQLIRDREQLHDEANHDGLAEHADREPCGCAWASEVRIFSPVKKTMYDARKFSEEHRGILPANFRLIKAITGDKSDNIVGIKGLGEATIVKLFPELLKTRVTPKALIEAAERAATVPEGQKRPTREQTLARKLLDEQSRFWENLTLVDLSDPMLSATAARQARDAMARDIGCREVEFRMALSRAGISFNDEKLVGPFRDFVLRRRKHLRTLKIENDHAATEQLVEKVEQQLRDGEE